MLLRNATILTEENPKALRVHNGRIAAVGDLSPEGAEEVLNLEGAFLLPGLWDTHIHLLFYARSLAQLDCSSCTSREDLLERVHERARATPEGEWIVASGWAEGRWRDSRLPTLDEIDAATLGRPAILQRSDLHSALVNRIALERSGIGPDTPDPEGGRIELENGRLVDLAIQQVVRAIPEPTPEQDQKLLREATARLNRYGIVGVCDQRIKDYPDGPLALALYRQLQLPLRIHCNVAAHQLEAEPFLSGDDRVRIGHIKFFADGSLGSRSARMREPYLQDGGRGLWLTRPEELVAGFARAHRRGYPISCHAIGDEAIGAVLDALEQVGTHPLDRVEHVQILHRAEAERMARLGLTASMQPVHLLDDRVIAERWLGDRARSYYRLASLIRAGVTLAFGSDAPVSAPDPWLGMLAASERRGDRSEKPWYPEESISVDRALRAYTADAATTLGWEGFGRIVPGAKADLVVIDRDPRQHCPTDVRVLRTIFDGSTVFHA